jgi:glycosyl transferase family 25
MASEEVRMNTIDVPVLVLNLDRSPERREAMKAMLDSFGVKFSFFSAVDGQSLGPEQETLYSRVRAFRESNRDLHPTEIACALSHIRMWEFVRDQDWAACLILEDDIQIGHVHIDITLLMNALLSRIFMMQIT